MFKTFCVLGVKSRVDLLTMNRHTASQIEGKREKRKWKRGNRNALGKKGNGKMETLLHLQYSGHVHSNSNTRCRSVYSIVGGLSLGIVYKTVTWRPDQQSTPKVYTATWQLLSRR